MGWLASESNWTFGHVPKDLVQEADSLALAAIGSEGGAVGEESKMEVSE